MAKLIDEPVSVHINKDSVITAFIWRKRLYRVNEVLSWWREPSEWWSGKAVRLFVRVDAVNSSAGAYELCKRGNTWSLYRVLD